MIDYLDIIFEGLKDFKGIENIASEVNEATNLVKSTIFAFKEALETKQPIILKNGRKANVWKDLGRKNIIVLRDKFENLNKEAKDEYLKIRTMQGVYKNFPKFLIDKFYLILNNIFESYKNNEKMLKELEEVRVKYNKNFNTNFNTNFEDIFTLTECRKSNKIFNY